jgi:YD repeat-containing protein
MKLLPLVFTLLASVLPVWADSFSYDDAGRLTAAVQSNGLSHSYTPDEEGNLLTVAHTGSDTTDGGGPGNNLPDWWEYAYFGMRGVDPQASPLGDGYGNLLKYALGLDPTVVVKGNPLALSLPIYNDGQIYPTLIFTRAKEASGFLTLQQSGELSIWQTSNVYLELVGVQDLGDGNEQITTRSLSAFSTRPRLFFRLKLTTP